MATEILRRMLDERGVKWTNPNSCLRDKKTNWVANGFDYEALEDPYGTLILSAMHQDSLTPEQAVAATLGSKKAKAHPYGYEPDTGAFDVTRCECGCLNDISATYCNDCGGEIEIDMNAEKEIYHRSRHLVFVEKHDDGSLEFGGKRYIAKDDA